MQKTLLPKESPLANEFETVLFPHPSIPTIAIVQQRCELIRNKDLLDLVDMAFMRQ